MNIKLQEKNIYLYTIFYTMATISITRSAIDVLHILSFSFSIISSALKDRSDHPDPLIIYGSFSISFAFGKQILTTTQ